MKKFSVLLNGKSAIRKIGVFPRIKPSQVENATAKRNLSAPFTSGGIPRHTLKSRSIVGMNSLIHYILLVFTGPKIYASIVKSVVVFVINIIHFGSTNNSVHENRTRRIAIFQRPIRIKGFCFLRPDGIPIPLHEPFVVVGINNRILTLSQSDKANRLVLRLDNRVSLHSVFHGLTSNEIVNCSAALYFNPLLNGR